MIITWMLSAILFTALLALAARCADVALRVAGRQARGVWLAALAIALLWPMMAPMARTVWPATSGLKVMTVNLPAIRVLSNSGASSPTWLTNLELIVVSAWVVVSLALLLRLARAFVLLERAQASARRQMVDGVNVLVSRTLGPAVVGLAEPRVLVPSSLLDLDEPLRRLVLNHEDEHRRAHDQWIIVGSALAVALLPWNVALWWIARRARLALEMDCDARVLARGANAQQYGKLLVFIAQTQPATSVAPMLAAGTSHLERRITAMCTPLPSRRRTRAAIALTGMTVALAAACTSDVADPVARPAMSSAAARTPTVVTEPYADYQLEKPARQIAMGSLLKYPAALRAAKIHGEVLAQFVVDVHGRVEPGTFKAVKSDHALFTQAVSDALPGLRFEPAEVGGKKVRQLVQQPFTFALSR